MKNHNKNIEKDKNRALDHWLGLSENLNWNENSRSYYRKLRTLEKPTQASQKLVDLTWEKISRTLENDKNLTVTENKCSKTLSDGFGNKPENDTIKTKIISQWRVLARTKVLRNSLVGSLVAIILVSLYFLTYRLVGNSPNILEKSNELVLSYYKKNWNNEDYRSIDIDITKNSISLVNNIYYGEIDHNIQLTFNRVIDFKGKKTDDTLHLSFESGFLLVHYKHEKDDLPKRRLIVNAGKTKFRVTGTKFLIEKKADSCALLVLDGSVLAIHNMKASQITKNQIWLDGQKTLYKAAFSEVAAVLNNFEYDPDYNGLLDKWINENVSKRIPEKTFIDPIIDKAVKKQEKKQKQIKSAPIVNERISNGNKDKNRIVLNNGEIIVGEILFRDKNKIIIRTIFDKAFEIKQADIQSIR